jgi:hypothetical protein
VEIASRDISSRKGISDSFVGTSIFVFLIQICFLMCLFEGFVAACSKMQYVDAKGGGGFPPPGPPVSYLQSPPAQQPQQQMGQFGAPQFQQPTMMGNGVLSQHPQQARELPVSSSFSRLKISHLGCVRIRIWYIFSPIFNCQEFSLLPLIFPTSKRMAK